MNDAPTSAGLGAIMILAGLGIPIMAALNSSLGTRLANPVLAAATLFALALVITLLVLALQSSPLLLRIEGIPPHLFTGGCFVAFYVLSITWIAPRIGVGNAVFLVLLGQLLASAVIDHFALLGAPRSSLSWQRAIGLVLMAAGVVLARRPLESD